jgi:hypothetical protein
MMNLTPALLLQIKIIYKDITDRNANIINQNYILKDYPESSRADD